MYGVSGKENIPYHPKVEPSKGSKKTVIADRPPLHPLTEGDHRHYSQLLSSINQQIESKKQHNLTLIATISDLTQANDAKDSQISTLKQEVGALRDDNAAKDGRISLLEQEVGSLRDDNAAMKQEVGALRDDNAAMKQEVTQLKELVQQLLQQNQGSFE